MTGSGKVDATEAIGREIIRADEWFAIPVMIVSRQRLAISRQATNGSAVVTRGKEIATHTDRHSRRPASLLRGEDPVALAVPDRDGVAIVLDVVQLPVVPNGALR